MSERSIKWHRQTKQETLRLLGGSENSGLSGKEAYRRLHKNGYNRFMEPRRQVYGIFRGLLGDPVLILTLVCAVLSLLLGEWLSSLPFWALFFAWGAVFFIRLLRELLRMQTKVTYFETPFVTVLRDGEAVVIPATRVVRGDTVLLHAGDIVPCDCRLLSCEALSVRLSWREGEKTVVRLYQKNAERIYSFGDTVQPPCFENMVYGGSEVTSGSASAIAVELGDTSFLGAMGQRNSAVREQRAHGELLNSVLPYCRFFSFVSLLLLFLVGLVALLVAPEAYSSLRVFLPVCIATASASVGVTELYFTALLFSDRRAIADRRLARNRVFVKHAAATEDLPYLTDLLILGTSAFSDGRLHFCSAYTGAGKQTSGPALQEIAEAMVLLAKAREALPAARCDRFTDPEDTTYLGELLNASRLDLHALDIRLRDVRMLAAGEEELIGVAVGEEGYRLRITENLTPVMQCTAVQESGRLRALTPEYLNALLLALEREHAEYHRTYTVIKEQNGQLILIGVLVLSEAFLPEPSVHLARLRSAGIRVSILSERSEDECRRYFQNCCPELTVEPADAFSKGVQEDLNAHLYAGVTQQAISDRLRALKKEGQITALLCNRAESRSLLSAATVRIVCDGRLALLTDVSVQDPEQISASSFNAENTCTCSVCQAADVVICPADVHGGGLAALEPAIGRLRLGTHRFRALLWNLTLVKLARALFFTLCTISGMGPPTAAEIFFACFGGDAAALLAALNGFVQYPTKQAFRPTDATLLRFFQDRRLWIPALVPAAGAWLLAVLLRATGLLSADAAQVFPFVGIMLLQTVLLTFAESEDVRMRSPSGYARLAALLLAPVAVAILLSLSIPAVGQITGLGTWSPALAVLCFLCIILGMIGTLLPSRGAGGADKTQR